MGKTSREKGKRGEREAVTNLKRIGCLSAERRVRNCEGDSDLVDAIPGVSIEVKLEARTAIVPAMKQAIAQAEPGEVPCVIHRETLPRGGGPANPWLLTIRLQDLPALLKAYQGELIC